LKAAHKTDKKKSVKPEALKNVADESAMQSGYTSPQNFSARRKSEGGLILLKDDNVDSIEAIK
jgi:hypothetical protein